MQTLLLAQARNSRVAVRPNIVLVSVDDAGWRDFGYHDSEIETPAIDRMAREGAALSAEAEPPLPRNQITLPEVLRRGGYGDNPPLKGWKGQLYEGGVRVPAIVYWPGKVAARRVSH